MDDRQQRLLTVAGLAIVVTGHRGVSQGERPTWVPKVDGLVGEGAQDVAAKRSVASLRRDPGGDSEVALRSSMFAGVEPHPTGEVRHLRDRGVRVAAKLTCTESAAEQRHRFVEQVAGEVAMISALRPRSGYGSVSPCIHEVGDRMVAEGGADALWFDTGVQQWDLSRVPCSCSSWRHSPLPTEARWRFPRPVPPHAGRDRSART